MSIGSRKHLSATTSPYHSLLSKRASFTPYSITIPATFRSLSTNTSNDPLLAPSSSTTTDGGLFPPEATGVNAWEAHFEDSFLSGHLPSIEPHIGYLRELGLDFGYGPTSIVQWIIEHVHVYGELPWYGTLLGTALMVRIVLLPIFRLGADASGRLASVQHVLRPMQDKMRAAKASNNHAEMMMVYKETKMIEKRAGIKKWRSFLPLLIQAPLAFGAFRLTRNMVDLPVPGLDTGGALWFTDLTASDPYMIIPALTSVFLYFGMRVSFPTPLNIPQAPILANSIYSEAETLAPYPPNNKKSWA